MASKRTNNKLLGFLRQMTGGFQPPVVKTKLETDGERSISTAEHEKLIRRVAKVTTPIQQRQGFDSYGKYIKPLTRQIAGIKLDNEAIETLAPEVRTAQTIVIPSIISPTDLRDGEIAIQSTSKLVEQDENDRISKVLMLHFNKQMKLSDKLPDYIHEALYGAGSKPLLVLPLTELDTIMNDPTAILGKVTAPAPAAATEALHAKLTELTTGSIHGIGDEAHATKFDKKDKKLSIPLASLQPAVEAAVASYLKTAELVPKPRGDASGKPDAPLYNLGGQFKQQGLKAELQGFIDMALESVNITDNPDILKLDKAKKSGKQAEIQKQVITYYKMAPLITVNPETKPTLGDPVVYELPPESVIPIFTPGAPTDHIGYFIAIDEFGNPIHLTGSGPAIDLTDNRRINPASLYKSFGLEENYHFHGSQMKNEQAMLMVSIYQTIVDAHLKGRLKDSGFDNVYLGATENIYRCMFARYLSERKTKLLFVPRQLMTYFCFKHNNDGTGRSKIEDIKFILSLKITLLICRMMAAMNGAVNRKKLNVNFTEEMGDPIQYIEMLKKEAIDKQVLNFTYDPSEITRTLAQRALTVAAKGIPGAENFEISSEPNEVRDNRPDDSLIEDLNNMMILGLDVPPSAMNLLSENEFSRSVATNNLFFSRRILTYQKVVCEKTARHIQVYTGMSHSLKSQIRDILTSGDENKAKAAKSADAGTVDDKKVSIDEKIADVIKHIITVLPAPDVAPNKAEFEELDNMINSLGTALEAVFDNDLGSTDDNPIATVRALVKSDIVREYLRKIGIARDVDVPEFNSELLNRTLAFRQRLANLNKGLKDIATKTVATPPDDTGMGGGIGGSNPTDTGGMPPDEPDTGGAPTF